MRKAHYLCTPLQGTGIVAEWLGSALQKLLQRFESARYLRKNPARTVRDFFLKAKQLFIRLLVLLLLM
jgi:hypothetical protein